MKRNHDRKEKYSRQASSLNKNVEEMVVTYSDSTSNFRFDFRQWQLPVSVTRDIASAFRAIAGAFTPLGRGTYWREIRHFIVFAQGGWKDIRTAPASLLALYGDSLARTDLVISTKRARYLSARRLLVWLARNRPYRPWSRFTLPPCPFPRHAVSHGHRGRFLGERTVKSILRACYREIDQGWAIFEKGQALLKLDLDRNAAGQTNELATALQTICRVGNGKIATERQLAKAHKSSVLRHCGLRDAAKYVQATAETLLPFYLAICLQTAGNTLAILHLRRDCLLPHGLDDNMARVVWGKPRSHADQQLVFDLRKKYAAPNLIGKVLALTAPLLPHCDPAIKNRLFLHSRDSVPAPLSLQTIHHQLARFLKKHRLPNFDPIDFRATVASLEQQTSKDVRRTQKTLNHRSLKTTLGYLERSPIVREQHEKLIRKFQGAFVRWVKKSDSIALRNNPNHTTSGNVFSIQNGFETVFGFSCKDPFSGVAPGSRKGEICLQFLKCALCPQSLIVIDDPLVAARLLQARNHLSDAKHKMLLLQGGTHRFKEAYQPLLKIVERDLLPKFEKKILRKANELLGSLAPLPKLE